MPRGGRCWSSAQAAVARARWTVPERRDSALRRGQPERQRARRRPRRARSVDERNGAARGVVFQDRGAVCMLASKTKSPSAWKTWQCRVLTWTRASTKPLAGSDLPSVGITASRTFRADRSSDWRWLACWRRTGGPGLRRPTAQLNPPGQLRWWRSSVVYGSTDSTRWSSSSIASTI